MNHSFTLLKCFYTLFVAVTLFTWSVDGFCANLLSDVRVSNQVLDLESGDTTQITWQMSGPSSVSVFICDLDGYVVKKLLTKSEFSAGAGTVIWDGRDNNGVPCPDSAYVPIIQVKSKRWHQVYNPTMQQWGERVYAEDIKYDPDQKQITYVLKKAAICLIRVGETDGGPLYGTLKQWAPRQAGTHQEYWDGLDAQGIVNVAERPKAKIMIDAIALPENSILIIGSSQPHVFKRRKLHRYPLHPASGNEVFMHSLHERRFCRDIDIEVTIQTKNGTSNKIPVIRNMATILVDISDREHSAYLQREGAEVYAFIDGAFVTEIKITEFPARLVLNTEKFSIGKHVLTINVKGTEDHLGTFSLAVSNEK